MPSIARSASIWNIDIDTDEGLEQLRSFLETGGDPDEIGKISGDFPGTRLVEASLSRNQSALETLIQFGADVNYGGDRHNDEGNNIGLGSPLLVASGLGYLEICEYLIAHGADANLVNRRLFLPGILNIPNIVASPLHRAAEDGQAEVIQLLMKYGADAEVAIRTIPIIGTYDSAIAAASRGGYLESVQALITGDADVNFQHRWGYSALHNAASYGHFEIVQYLVEQGAEVNQRGGVFGMTPLYLVKGRGDRRDIEQYLKGHDGIASIHWWYYLLLMMGGSFSGFGP